MKLSIVFTFSLASTVAARNASLRGYDHSLEGSFDEFTAKDSQDNVAGPFDVLKCMIEGRTSADKCSVSINTDGEPCDYCTLSENGEEAGFCVDPQVAEQMKQQNPDVSCSNDEFTAKDSQDNVAGPFDVLKCSIEGRTSADKCSVSVSTDGEPCDYCTLSENGEEAGLCVDPQVAEQMKQQNPDVSCSNDEFTAKDSKNNMNNNASNPLKCFSEGQIDSDKCSVSFNDDGEPCSFCTQSWNDRVEGECVDPKIARAMMYGNSNISCTNIEMKISHFLSNLSME